MGDVNYLFHSKSKIDNLLKKLEILKLFCDTLIKMIDELNFPSDEEIDALTFLSELYDERLICLARLKLIMTSRLNFLTERQ